MMKHVKDALKNEELTQKQLQGLILQMAEKIEDLESKVRDFEEMDKVSAHKNEESAPRITLI
jgi:hypothetical protein